MKRLFWRLSPEMVLCLAIAGMGLGSVGCSDPNNSVPAGPPVLTSWSVVDNATGARLDVTTDGGPIPISGFVHLNALFDRLLDGSAVTTLDGGVDQGTDAIAIDITPTPPARRSRSTRYTRPTATTICICSIRPDPASRPRRRPRSRRARRSPRP